MHTISIAVYVVSVFVLPKLLPSLSAFRQKRHYLWPRPVNLRPSHGWLFSSAAMIMPNVPLTAFIFHWLPWRLASRLQSSRLTHDFSGKSCAVQFFTLATALQTCFAMHKKCFINLPRCSPGVLVCRKKS